MDRVALAEQRLAGLTPERMRDLPRLTPNAYGGDFPVDRWWRRSEQGYGHRLDKVTGDGFHRIEGRCTAAGCVFRVRVADQAVTFAPRLGYCPVAQQQIGETFEVTESARPLEGEIFPMRVTYEVRGHRPDGTEELRVIRRRPLYTELR